MMTINLLKEGQRKDQRMVVQDCLNMMWEEFSQIVPISDQARIGRFLTYKDAAHDALSRDVPKN